MGSEGRRHYDITMSKRTRRSFYIKNGQMESDWENDSFLLLANSPKENEEEVNAGDREKDGGDPLSDRGQILVGSVDSPKEEVPENLECTCKHELTLSVGDTEEKREGKRFEKLINGEKEEKAGRSSLGQHFTKEEKEKEKQMQVVVRKQKQEGGEGLKFKGLMRRYAKVLGHLIKNKHEPRKGSRNKPLLQLTM